MKVLSRMDSYVYALFRIVFGLLFLMHGTQKLFGWPLPGPQGLPPFIKFGAFLELVLGVMIVLGVYAGIAAFIASGEMAVAYFMAHAPGGVWPIVNKGELAVLFCFAFLFIAARGAGIWSVDSALKKA